MLIKLRASLVYKILSKLFEFYKTLNILSFDVVVGSVTSYYFFCKFLKVDGSVLTASILGLTVWVIYTLDHLIDSRKVDWNYASPRHLYHKLHFKSLSIGIILAILVLCHLITFLDYELLKNGIILSGSVLIYFISIHLLRWNKIVHKELAVAFIYTCGIALGPVTTLNHLPDLIQITFIATFFHIVIMNLLIFSVLDAESDKASGFQSIYQLVGEKLNIAISYLFFQGLLLSIFLFGIVDYSPIIFPLPIMLVSLFILHRVLFGSPSKDSVIPRILGDGVFIFPIIFFFLE